MNPIEEWETLRIEEVKAGGNPSICILGWHDYESLCGAIMIAHGLESFGNTGYTEYQGIRLFDSRSIKKGIMFA